jgi:hypothetical protein
MAATHTITRARYEALVRHEYAGTAADLTAATIGSFTQHCPDWHGKHWYMHASDHGTALSPVNVVK